MRENRRVRIADIRRPGRHRKDMGDLAGLAASMASVVGQLQPIGLTRDLVLLFGGRRLAAAEQLDWTEIDAVILNDLDDALAALQAERDENEHRKEMTPSEKVELARRIEELERPAAQERMTSGKGPSGQLAGGSAGEARDIAAKAAGFASTAEYRRAAFVVDHGVPGLLRAVGSGEVSVSAAAEVAKLPKAEQEKAVAGGPAVVRAAAKKARAEKAKKPVPSNPGRADSNPKSVLDAFGIPVQAHAAEAWEAVPKFEELIRKARELGREFSTLAEHPGGVWLQQPALSSYRAARRTDDGAEAGRFVSAALDRFVKDLEDSIPTYSVCPWQFADKPHPDDCPTCRQLNWTPPLLSGAVPAEVARRVKEAHGV